MPEAWKTIVPEGKDVIESFYIVGGKIYVKRLHDVKSEISVYTLDGKAAGQVDLEGIGTASGVAGRTIDRYGFFSFESYIQPPTIYRIDTLTGKREPFAEPKTPFETAAVRPQAGLLQIQPTARRSPCSSPARRASSRMAPNASS